MTGIIGSCDVCVWFHDDEELPPLTCAAFPEGIPEDILDGAPHTEPREGDHGIQFSRTLPES